MSLGTAATKSSLRLSVRASLQLAEQHGCRSISFPAIGAGIVGFPLNRCAKIMITEMDAHLKKESKLETIYLVLYGQETYTIFCEVFNW